MSVDFGKLTTAIKKLESAAVSNTKSEQANVDNVFADNKASVSENQQQNKNISLSEINKLQDTLLKSYVLDESAPVGTGAAASASKQISSSFEYLFKDVEKDFSFSSIAGIVGKTLAELGEKIAEENEKNDKLVNINGELDEQVKQKGTGDCYLLTTLNALNSTPEGQKIISNMISHDEDRHSYTVKFPGVDVSYTFSATEVVKAENKNYEKVSSDGVRGTGNSWYSEGDDDALLLEMAFERFREDVKDGRYDDKEWPDFVYSASNYNDNKSALDSGSMSQVYYLMTGEKVSFAENTEANPNAVHETLDKIQESGKPYAMYASINAKNGYTEDANGEYYIDYFNGNTIKKVDDTTPADAQRYTFSGGGSNESNKITLSGVNADGKNDSISISNNSDGGHALAITGVTEDTVTIINPWDSDKEITVNREEFEGYMNNIQFADLNKHGGGGKKRAV